MKNFFVLAFLFAACTSFGQKQFSVVCNQNESKFEVIVMGEEKSYHQVIKDGFPNQRAAETYLNEKGPTITCGNRNPNAPPPTTAGRKPSGTAKSGVSRTPGASTIRPASAKYGRNFRIMGNLSYLFSMDKLYPGVSSTFSQGLGYSIGIDAAIGNSFQVGAGFHYTSILGSFQEMQLDVDFDDPDFFGSLSALKGEFLMKSASVMRNGSAFIFEFGIGYYFNVNTSTDIPLEELLPVINEQFFGIRWGLGKDVKGFNVILSGEFLMGVTDDTDIVEKEAFFNLKLGLGYAF